MAVTQLGIKAPDLPDPFNPVGDMNTLASTADTAIRQAASRGTAAQRAAFTAAAPNGTLWQDTDGVKMIWRKDGASWVPAVWRWSGTTAQMNAFTQAPTGFKWFNSSESREYVRLAGAWSFDSGPSGTVTFNSGAGSQISGSVFYGAATNVLIPVVAGPGETIRVVDVARAATWGFLSQIGPGTVSGGVTSVPVRSIIIGSAASISLTVAWDLVKTG